MWFTEIGQITHEAAHVGEAGHLDAVQAALLRGDPVRLLEAFPGGVRIDDPRLGRVDGSGPDGQAALEDFCHASHAWLQERQASSTSIGVSVGRERVVGEFELSLVQDGRAFVLPVAFVVEPDGLRQSVWIRTYHSQWPILGHHVVRPPLLARDPDAHESDVVGRYQRALAAGDADAITATFEPDGCFREPAGPEHRRCGTDTLHEFFAMFFSAGGGIILEHCTVTDDGVRTALEFNAVRWGATDLPHQAGVAVYERGPSGLLHEARIYDDVEGPVE